MKVRELPLPEEFTAHLNSLGFVELFPPQAAAVEAGLLEGRSLLVASPTACYDEETQVLTRVGWKLFKDTSPKEEVLSLNPKTLEMEYVNAENKIEYFYRGTMVHVAGKEIDFRVTENHNMFVHHTRGKLAKHTSAARIMDDSNQRYRFHPAREIRSNWKFVTGGAWKGKRQEYFELPRISVKGRYPSNKRNLPEVRIPMQNFLDFLGWYIAEGFTKFGNGDYEVTLCQKKEKFRAKRTLERLGLAKVYSTGPENHKHYSISCPQLARYLSQFGKAPEKYVPDFVKGLTSEQISIFLESYGRGDGHIARDGVSQVFNATSGRLADDVQELLLKAGVSSSVRLNRESPPHAVSDGHLIISRHQIYEIAGRKYSEHAIDYRKRSRPSFEATEGEMVYCLTLPKYHLLYVRRNGKPFWCGNSGKTLVAALAAFKRIVEEHRKVVYLSPLRALASEKFAEFKSLLEKFGVRCVISTGDFDSAGEALKSYDLLVLTNEKFDSLLRHGISWLSDVGLFVSDEVHLAGSGDRGPTLEMILTKVIHSGVKAQLLSLSATVSNAEEIARWLRSDLVELTWRPVPLREGVYDHGRVWFGDLQGEIQTVRSTYGAAIDVAVQSISTGGQSLIFTSTRRRAVSLATKASELTSRYLGEAERRACSDASRRIRDSGEETGLSRLLADLVSKGAAFHHAGLPHEHRKIVEDAYRERAVKLLASTPTLAAGVNLPARRVVIADLSRYDGELGMSSAISVLEYRQMAGRAGRPQYDEFGETVMVPPPALSPEEAMRHYVESSPEPIESRLGGERGMRVHLLAVIASRIGITREEIDSVFSKTLLAAQIGKEEVARHLDAALGYLFAEQLVVEKGGAFHATAFGKRISTLYIDPMTGVLFKKNLGGFQPGPDHTLKLLHLIAKSPDFQPKFPMRSEKYSNQAYEFLETNRASFSLADDRRSSFMEYEDVLQDMRTVMVIDSWIDEQKEDAILERLGAEPGDLHRAVDSAEWLLYCLCELARLFGKYEVIKEAGFLRKRVEKGVKGELVELTKLHFVGRARARSLYNFGFKTIKSIREAPAEKLGLVEKIGPVMAERIKEEAAR